MTGQSIAHDRISAKLGQGGMGAVCHATDTKLDREVAIKVFPESFARDRDRLARFEREAHRRRQGEGPRLRTGQDGGSRFRMHRSGCRDAHRGDYDPGAVMGTPAYLSPEQARGQTVDRRRDVWAFGCCLYECLTGAKPFRGDTVADLLAAVLRNERDWTLLPEETSQEVSTLLRRCLEKVPRRRLSSLGDFAITLDESTQVNRRPAEAVSTVTPAKHSETSRPSWAWPVAAVPGTALVVAAFYLGRGRKTPATASNIRSLAMLPFDIETQDPKLSGLGKWIPADIRLKLGSFRNLQVVNSPARIEQLVQQKNSGGGDPECPCLPGFPKGAGSADQPFPARAAIRTSRAQRQSVNAARHPSRPPLPARSGES